MAETDTPVTPETAAAEPAVGTADLTALVDRLVAARLAELTAPSPAAVPEWLGPLLANQQRVADTLAVHTRPKQIDNPEQRSPFNPAGDRDHPRPELKCDIRHCGVSLSRTTLTVTEIDLLNRLEPGEYWIRKTDGSEEKVTIVPKLLDTGDGYAILNIRMDVKDETGTKKHGWPSLANLCRQILGEPEVHPPARKSTQVRRAAKGGESDLSDQTLRDIAHSRPEIATALQSMMDRPADRV
jgi:hypothetical protein